MNRSLKFYLITLVAILASINSFAIAPIIVPMNTSGFYHSNVHILPKDIYAIFIALNVMCILGLAIRYIIIRESKYFEKQSKIKNIFYELDEYYCLKTDLNFISICLIVINLFAIFIALMGYIASII